MQIKLANPTSSVWLLFLLEKIYIHYFKLVFPFVYNKFVHVIILSYAILFYNFTYVQC